VEGIHIKYIYVGRHLRG